MLRHKGDSIVAVATPSGCGGVAIVRLSGPCSLTIMAAVVVPRSEKLSQQRALDGHHQSSASTLPTGEVAATARIGAEKTGRAGWRPRHMYLVSVVEADGSIVDQALAVYMPGPHSFTGEDVCEIHCHGGLALPGLIVQLCIAQGARLADPGEFTLRAFLAGKLDLAQAESVLGLIEADSRRAVHLAARGLEGSLSRQVQHMRSRLLRIVAELEAELDYGDEVSGLEAEQIAAVCSSVLADIDNVLIDAQEGELLVEGVYTVLAGLPNVGKSSLWNSLIGEERALVTPYAGTTRDQLECRLSIQGICFKLVDTAGLRDSSDPVEQMGVSRSRQAITRAQLLVVVLDSSRQVQPQLREVLASESLDSGAYAGVVVVLNKQDLALPTYGESVKDIVTEMLGECHLEIVKTILGGEHRDEVGVRNVQQALVDIVRGLSAWGDNQAFSVNARQRQALVQARQSLEGCQAAIGFSMPSDCLLLDLHQALSSLGAVVGSNVSEDILDEVFSRFCLGK